MWTLVKAWLLKLVLQRSLGAVLAALLVILLVAFGADSTLINADYTFSDVRAASRETKLLPGEFFGASRCPALHLGSFNFTGVTASEGSA